jgi:hypothetical protein
MTQPGRVHLGTSGRGGTNAHSASSTSIDFQRPNEGLGGMCAKRSGWPSRSGCGEAQPLGALPGQLLGIARTVADMAGSDFVLPARLSESTLYVPMRR